MLKLQLQLDGSYSHHFGSHEQKYFLVPIRQEPGEEPVLALLVRKKQ